LGVEDYSNFSTAGDVMVDTAAAPQVTDSELEGNVGNAKEALVVAGTVTEDVSDVLGDSKSKSMDFFDVIRANTVIYPPSSSALGTVTETDADTASPQNTSMESDSKRGIEKKRDSLLETESTSSPAVGAEGALSGVIDTVLLNPADFSTRFNTSMAPAAMASATFTRMQSSADTNKPVTTSDSPSTANSPALMGASRWQKSSPEADTDTDTDTAQSVQSSYHYEGLTGADINWLASDSTVNVVDVEGYDVLALSDNKGDTAESKSVTVSTKQDKQKALTGKSKSDVERKVDEEKRERLMKVEMEAGHSIDDVDDIRASDIDRDYENDVNSSNNNRNSNSNIRAAVKVEQDMFIRKHSIDDVDDDTSGTSISPQNQMGIDWGTAYDVDFRGAPRASFRSIDDVDDEDDTWIEKDPDIIYGDW
jgi:hypothetical protein